MTRVRKTDLSESGFPQRLPVSLISFLIIANVVLGLQEPVPVLDRYLVICYINVISIITENLDIEKATKNIEEMSKPLQILSIEIEISLVSNETKYTLHYEDS
jgi:uncharacterized membrane protein YqgA involved in biofilm formation